MPELHLDQNVPSGIAAALPHYTVHTARALGLRQAEDAEHLLHAAQHQRVLITKDKNFYALHFGWVLWAHAWGVQPTPEHAGILLIHDHWTMSQAAHEIDQILSVGWPFPNRLYEYQGSAHGGRWVRY